MVERAENASVKSLSVLVNVDTAELSLQLASTRQIVKDLHACVQCDLIDAGINRADQLVPKNLARFLC